MGAQNPKKANISAYRPRTANLTSFLVTLLLRFFFEILAGTKPAAGLQGKENCKGEGRRERKVAETQAKAKVFPKSRKKGARAPPKPPKSFHNWPKRRKKRQKKEERRSRRRDRKRRSEKQESSKDLKNGIRSALSICNPKIWRGRKCFGK